MRIDKETIRNNSMKVYNVMLRMYHYSFVELRKISQLGDVELCFALMELIRENMIKQDNDGGSVYYAVCYVPDNARK